MTSQRRTKYDVTEADKVWNKWFRWKSKVGEIYKKVGRKVRLKRYGRVMIREGQ